MMMWTTQGDPRPAFGRMFLVTLLVCCLSATKMAAAAGEQMADFAIQANRGQIYWQYDANDKSSGYFVVRLANVGTACSYNYTATNGTQIRGHISIAQLIKGMSDQSPSYAQGSWVARGYEMDKYIRLSNPPFKSLRVIPNTSFEWGPVQDLYTTWNLWPGALGSRTAAARADVDASIYSVAHGEASDAVFEKLVGVASSFNEPIILILRAPLGVLRDRSAPAGSPTQYMAFQPMEVPPKERAVSRLQASQMMSVKGGVLDLAEDYLRKNSQNFLMMAIEKFNPLPISTPLIKAILGWIWPKAEVKDGVEILRDWVAEQLKLQTENMEIAIMNNTWGQITKAAEEFQFWVDREDTKNGSLCYKYDYCIQKFAFLVNMLDSSEKTFLGGATGGDVKAENLIPYQMGYCQLWIATKHELAVNYLNYNYQPDGEDKHKLPSNDTRRAFVKGPMDSCVKTITATVKQMVKDNNKKYWQTDFKRFFFFGREILNQMSYMTLVDPLYPGQLKVNSTVGVIDFGVNRDGKTKDNWNNEHFGKAVMTTCVGSNPNIQWWWDTTYRSGVTTAHSYLPVQQPAQTKDTLCFWNPYVPGQGSNDMSIKQLTFYIDPIPITQCWQKGLKGIHVASKTQGMRAQREVGMPNLDLDFLNTPTDVTWIGVKSALTFTVPDGSKGVRSLVTSFQYRREWSTHPDYRALFDTSCPPTVIRIGTNACNMMELKNEMTVSELVC